MRQWGVYTWGESSAGGGCPSLFHLLHVLCRWCALSPNCRRWGDHLKLSLFVYELLSLFQGELVHSTKVRSVAASVLEYRAAVIHPAGLLDILALSRESRNIRRHLCIRETVRLSKVVLECAVYRKGGGVIAARESTPRWPPT